MIPKRFFVLLDLLVIFISFAIAYAAWPHLYHSEQLYRDVGVFARLFHPSSGEGAPLPQFRQLLWIFAVAAPATVFFLGMFEGHAPLLQQSRSRIVASCLVSPLLSAGVVGLIVFATGRSGISRVLVFGFSFLAAVGLCTLRLALRSYLLKRREAGFYAKGVLLIGRGEHIKLLLGHFEQLLSAKEYRVVGYIADQSGAGDPVLRELLDTIGPPLGTIDNIGDLLIHRPIHEVVAIHPVSGAPWLRKVISDCDDMNVLLRIIPENLLVEKPRTLQNLYPKQILHLPAIVLAPPHFDSDALFFKRVFDIVVSAFLLLLLSPLFLLIAILIKLADRRSPVFYRWNVVGRNGARFTGFKFTTMYADADERRKDLLDKNEMTGPVFKIQNDPRVTPIGRFLRKFSLNELPQLWSVLKGDMSLVGPRPAFPHELDGYGFWHKRKLSIRPGITCLWQVRGRNKISSFDDWVKMDLEYIDNWSLWLDFKILVRTAWAVVAGTGS